jgi:hypothetical protein
MREKKNDNLLFQKPAVKKLRLEDIVINERATYILKHILKKENVE